MSELGGKGKGGNEGVRWVGVLLIGLDWEFFCMVNIYLSVFFYEGSSLFLCKILVKTGYKDLLVNLVDILCSSLDWEVKFVKLLNV